jgi:hypothetical protein
MYGVQLNWGERMDIAAVHYTTTLMNDWNWYGRDFGNIVVNDTLRMDTELSK